MKGLWRFHHARVAAGSDAAPALEQNLREVLIESRQRYKDLVEISSDFAWETDADGRFAFVSPRGALGYAAGDLVGRPAHDFLVDAESPGPFVTATKVEAIELGFRRKDGAVAVLSTAAMPRYDDLGNVCGARGVCRDVTEARLREAELDRARRRERLYAEIVAAIRDVVEPSRMLGVAAEAMARALDADGCCIFRYAPERGFALAASTGEATWCQDPPPLLLDALEQGAEGTRGRGGLLVSLARYRQAVNGALCLAFPKGAKAWHEEVAALVAAVADQLGIAIEQIANHEALERLSHGDPLTGLLNRRGFFDQLARCLARADFGGQSAALLYVDLDNFKPVNDRLGHQRGDELLIHVARLLERGTRPGDLIGRLGGDEFALWLDGVDEESAKIRAARLIRSAAELASFSADPARPLGFSIGIAAYDGATRESMGALTVRADAAMYDVKHNGKGGFRIAASAASYAPRKEAIMENAL
jgi:diguanylate cyclase (GGDEF)-like protein/PAS domain S-box-containing protein